MALVVGLGLGYLGLNFEVCEPKGPLHDVLVATVGHRLERAGFGLE